MSRHRGEPTPWCPECKGNGACTNCFGTGSRGYWWKRICPVCDGARDCTWCAGTGDDPEARP